MGMSISRFAMLATAVALAFVWSAGGDSPSPVSAQALAEADRPAVTSDPVDGYMVLAPSVLRSGQTEGISVSLFSGRQPARGTVQLALLSRNAVWAEATGSIEGTGAIPLSVPDISRGYYQLTVAGPGFQEAAWIMVEAGDVLFVETDKPIYKPGQDMHIRVLLLDIELKPMSGHITVEVQDAKGNKVFREVVESDEFGMASLTMPLSTEPNFGKWSIAASFGEQEAQTDVRVERYVLPKYEIDVDFPQEWTLFGEPITGTVSAEYSFGKPVRGELKIVASKYNYEWVEFAEFTAEIDGTASFELPATEYISSGRGPDGTGNVSLEVIVEEKATGHVETTTAPHTVVYSTVNIRLIPEGSSFKPSLPFSVLLVTDSPDRSLIGHDVGLETYYFDEGLSITYAEESRVNTVDGKALVSITPPEGTVAIALMADAGGNYASTVLKAAHSPSDSFIQLEQVPGTLAVGDQAQFKVHSTEPSGSFYYEVVARGRVVLSDVSASSDIGFTVSPVMAGMSRLVVYQVMPSGEVAADYLPFEVAASYPLELDAAFDSDEARPGDEVEITLTTQGRAKVGLAAVDRSVYLLGDNRVNLQQVFADLERFSREPEFEFGEDLPYYYITTQGAEETFRDAGLVVMTNREVPVGKTHYRRPQGGSGGSSADVALLAPGPPSPDLTDIQRVRQYFPETWLWTDVMTDDAGSASVTAEAPDSITTWMLRAVGLSKEHGLGIAETQLRVFQPFFLEVDLPYSAIRGEEFSVKVALHNYLDTTQEFFVELEESGGFTLLGDAMKTVSVGPNDLSLAQFKIRLTELGTTPLKVTARSREASDGVIKELLIEPEGVPQEVVTNKIVAGGDSFQFPNAMPPGSISGSARTHVSLSGSFLSQTMEGLEDLLRMSYGCGEQNMLNFAPNVFVARYLEQTGQLKPELTARVEHLMLTGYQRQMMFRRADGSFATWGDRSASGSIWLTAFVLKTLAQADRFIYVDQDVIAGAAEWILDHQNEDGSFEQVGGAPNGYLYGGLEGATALTAYVAIALHEAGLTTGADLAIGYLENQLDDIDDSYTMAVVSYALELGKSSRADDAYDQLLAMAIRDENGLHWERSEGQPSTGRAGTGTSVAVENTGYAVLALLEHGDGANAGEAVDWLASQRNAYGGFYSTQDTVVGLQALFQYSVHIQNSVEMTVTMTSGDWSREVEIDRANADIVQVVNVPVGEDIQLVAEGGGEAIVQVVHRFNRPEAQIQPVETFTLDVDYSPDRVRVDEVISVSATVDFVPEADLDVGMVVLDIGIPTGFSPVIDTLESLVNDNAKIWRYDIAERKVVLYLEDLVVNETIDVQFDIKALHPIITQPVTSQVYSYYNPQWRAETLGASVTVGDVPESTSACVTGGAVADETNAGLVSDCEALLEARDTLAGTAALNWSENTPIAQWEGIALQGTPDRVTWLDLYDGGLDGTIPAELGRLTNLTYLSLRGNDLDGPIPAELGDLANLRVLNLHSNNVSGNVPDLSTTMLEELYLANNYDETVQGSGLTGEIPVWLNGMTNMRELWLWGNRLTGSIPDLSGMTGLEKLKLADNMLDGGVPAGSMLPPNVTWLIIDRNPLGGTIPDLSSLTSLKLLWLHNNELESSIPAWQELPPNVDDLNLRDNMLTGEIPDLSGLDKLTRLRLHNNSLNGEVPATLGDLDMLMHLWLHNEVDKGLGNNSFTSIAAGVGDLADTLIEIALRGNSWADDACVPTALANVTKNDYADAGIEVCSADDGS